MVFVPGDDLDTLDRIPLYRHTINVDSQPFSLRALIIIVSVLVVFLCPATTGSFSSVNGPATALRAMRSAVQIQQEIARGGLGWLSRIFAASSNRLASPIFSIFSPLVHPVESVALRC